MLSNGDRCRLRCPMAQAYNGRTATIVRQLVLDVEVGREVGPMFRVAVDGLGSFDAFEGELEPLPKGDA